MEDEKLLSVGEENEPHKAEVFRHKPSIPSIKQQSWGTLISIIIIVFMIVIGAFYAWGQRIAENNAYPASSVMATSTL